MSAICSAATVAWVALCPFAIIIGIKHNWHRIGNTEHDRPGLFTVDLLQRPFNKRGKYGI